MTRNENGPKGLSGLMAFVIILGIVFALFLAFGQDARANGTEVTISGGKKGLTYEKWGRALQLLLRQQGIKSTYVKSKGADQNVKRVMKGEATVAFTQGDVAKKNGTGYEIMGVLGKECVFVAVNKDGLVTDEDDLQGEVDGRAPKIAVGGRGTGSQVSWEYMGTLEDGYKASAQDYSSGNRALGKLAAKQLDAVMFVTAPGNYAHKMVSAVNNNDALVFIDIDDSDLNDKLPDGKPVYTFETIVVDERGWDTKVQTICTPVLAIADPSADEEVLEELSSIFVNNVAAITQ